MTEFNILLSQLLRVCLLALMEEFGLSKQHLVDFCSQTVAAIALIAFICWLKTMQNPADSRLQECGMASIF